MLPVFLLDRDDIGSFSAHSSDDYDIETSFEQMTESVAILFEKMGFLATVPIGDRRASLSLSDASWKTFPGRKYESDHGVNALLTIFKYCGFNPSHASRGMRLVAVWMKCV